jgi:hypothetical protein
MPNQPTFFSAGLCRTLQSQLMDLIAGRGGSPPHLLPLLVSYHYTVPSRARGRERVRDTIMTKSPRRGRSASFQLAPAGPSPRSCMHGQARQPGSQGRNWDEHARPQLESRLEKATSRNRHICQVISLEPPGISGLLASRFFSHTTVSLCCAFVHLRIWHLQIYRIPSGAIGH